MVVQPNLTDRLYAGMRLHICFQAVKIAGGRHGFFGVNAHRCDDQLRISLRKRNAPFACLQIDRAGHAADNPLLRKALQQRIAVFVKFAGIIMGMTMAEIPQVELVAKVRTDTTRNMIMG